MTLPQDADFNNLMMKFHLRVAIVVLPMLLCSLGCHSPEPKTDLSQIAPSKRAAEKPLVARKALLPPGVPPQN